MISRVITTYVLVLTLLLHLWGMKELLNSDAPMFLIGCAAALTLPVWGALTFLLFKTWKQ